MKYMQLMTRSTDLVIFPSNFAMYLHKKLGFFKNSYVKVLPNGIPLVNKTSQKRYDFINVLYVGTLSFYKGVHILLSAFNRCTNPRLRLHVVGDGSDATYLRHISQHDARIIFHGRVSDSILEDLYYESNFLVLPSMWYEVLPVVIQESMSHGTPVVGSAIGGIRDLVIDGYNGRLFKPGDVEDLSHIIEELSTYPETLIRLSENCLKFIEDFDINKHAKSLLCIYQNLVEQSDYSV
jgi:glycosyltransferase involved in cell wall biosynthesis